MNKTKQMTIAAMMLALGFILPFVTMNIPQIGSMLLPMHLPVLLCGFICGPVYGLIVGFITPLLRSITVGMPPMFPIAICMAFELAVYGFISGFIYNLFKKQSIKEVYIALLVAMVGGRLVWGLARLVLLGIKQLPFNATIFYTSVIASGIPGVILQLILIPVILVSLDKMNIIKFKK